MQILKCDGGDPVENILYTSRYAAAVVSMKDLSFTSSVWTMSVVRLRWKDLSFMSSVWTMGVVRLKKKESKRRADRPYFLCSFGVQITTVLKDLI